MFSLGNYKLVLASNSPRRKELLRGLGFPFEVRTLPGIDESYPEGLAGADIPLYIARKKAEAYRGRMGSGELLLTADTIVWVDGRVLGKPADAADAMRMLRLLSGRTHTVYTGVCLIAGGKEFVDVVHADVTFEALTDEVVAAYVATGKPLDKAGAYGIQDGFPLVRSYRGSFSCIMGLPLERLSGMLREAGLI